MSISKFEPTNHPLTKLFSGILCLVFALAISCVAAFFSVTGLATIFSAAFMSVVVMGVVLESGKLVAAGWLHANWKNPRAGFIIKAYLCLAIFALMIITGIGIYGYLSKAYLDQSAPVGVVNVQIQAYQQQIDQDNSNINRFTTEQKQMDSQIDSLVNQNKIYLSQSIRKSQTSERAQVQTEITQAEQDIVVLNQKMEPLQVQESGTNAKLGPIKYVAALIGWTDLDSAVRLVILIIMFAFDPLAVVLLLSGTISLGEWMDSRTPKAKPETVIIPSVMIQEPVAIPVHEAIIVQTKQPIEEPVDEPILELIADPEKSFLLKLDSEPTIKTKEELTRVIIDQLAKNPEILQEVIDVVTEFNEKKSQ